MKSISTKTFVLVGLCLGSLVWASGAERYVIAYLPFGGGWSSRILLVNPSDRATNVELSFFSSEASLASVRSAPSEASWMRLEAGATKSIELNTIIGEPTGLAWAVAQSDAPLQVFSTFDFSVPDASPLEGVLDASRGEDCAACIGSLSQSDKLAAPIEPPGRPGDRPEGEKPPGPPGPPSGRPPVSIPVTTPVITARVSSNLEAAILPSGTGFVFPVSIFGSRNFNAFLALANPNESAAAVTLNLVYEDGVQQLNRVVQLPPRGQMTRLLTDAALFGDLGAAADGFDGTVTVCSDRPVGVVAIGLAGEMAYTLPVAESGSCPGTN